jgi:nicotinamide mononucleotide transporter
MKRVYKDWSVLDIVMSFVYIVSLLVISIIFHSSPISIVMAIGGIIAGILNTKTSRFCFPIYCITALLYAYISFRNGVYGETIMNVFYLFPLYLKSSLKLFDKNAKGRTKFLVKHATKKQIITFFLIGLGIFLGYGGLLYALHSKFPSLNSLAIAISVAASYFSSKHIYEHWGLWIVYNMLLIVLWMLNMDAASSDAVPIIVQDIIYTILNVFGMIEWRKIEKEQKQILLNESKEN